MELPNQDPKYYKLRTFYYNPEDKRLIVRSYFTDRFILNYSKPWAWILTVLFTVILAAGIVVKVMGIQ